VLRAGSHPAEWWIEGIVVKISDGARAGRQVATSSAVARFTSFGRWSSSLVVVSLAIEPRTGTTLGHLPLIVGLDQHGAGQPQHSGIIGEDADHVGAALDLLVGPLH
jgi:hypothetical protein